MTYIHHNGSANHSVPIPAQAVRNACTPGFNLKLNHSKFSSGRLFLGAYLRFYIYIFISPF